MPLPWKLISSRRNPKFTSRRDKFSSQRTSQPPVIERQEDEIYDDLVQIYNQLVEISNQIGSEINIPDVLGLQSALDGKAPTNHAHVISDVAELQTTLNDKAPITHTHAISDVMGLQASLDAKALTSHSHVISDVTNLQTTLNSKASTTHTHVVSDTTGLQTSLDSKQVSLVSGTNIKSINSESILGLGNLKVKSGVHAPIILATGNYYNNSINAGAKTTLSRAGNSMIFVPIQFSENMTLLELGFEITSTVASSLGKIMLYDSLNGLPNARLFDSPNQNTASIGTKLPALSLSVVSNQTYYASINHNAGSNITFRCLSLANVISVRTVVGTANNVTAFTMAMTFGKEPSTINQSLLVASTATPPEIIFKT